MAAAWTGIPATQPSCSSITLSAPTPNCPSIPSDPLGCFIQPTGLFCAPLSTTRGFLYTLDAPTANTSSPSQETPRIAAGAKVTLIPQLHIPPPPLNQSLVAVDGQPVKSQGPALLGQICAPIPLPPPTHPVWPVLVAMANKRLNETVGFSDMGTGENVFALRGDCEPGAFCDTATSGATEGKGVCVEQLPNYHTCSSYVQCISLRCSQDHTLAKRAKEEEGAQDVAVGGKRRPIESVSSSPSSRPDQQRRHNSRRLSPFTKRRVVSVCVPLSHEPPGSGTGGGTGGDRAGAGEAPDLNSGDSEHHEIPGWAAGIIGSVLLVCVLVGLVFIRRRKVKQQEKKRASQARQASGAGGGEGGGRERERSMSVGSGGLEKRAEALESGDPAHAAAPVTIVQEVAARSVFGRLFEASKKSAGKLSLPRRSSADARKRRHSISTVASYRTNRSASLTLDSAYSGGASFEGYGRYDVAGVPSGHSSRRASTQSNVLRRASAPAIPQITTTFSEPLVIPAVSRSETFSGGPPGGERPSTDIPLAPASAPLRFREGEMPYEMATPSSTTVRLSPQPTASSSGASSPRSISTRMSYSPNNLSVPNSPISPISPISPLMGTAGTSRLSTRNSYRHGST